MKRSDFVLRAAAATERCALFPLGEVSTTRSALKRLGALGLESSDLIARHQTGDWGDVDDADHAMNEKSSYEEHRFLSAYDIEAERFWVLTSADRSRTWVLSTTNRSSSAVFLPGDATPDPPPADPSRERRKRRVAHLIQP